SSNDLTRNSTMPALMCAMPVMSGASSGDFRFSGFATNSSYWSAVRLWYVSNRVLSTPWALIFRVVRMVSGVFFVSMMSPQRVRDKVRGRHVPLAQRPLVRRRLRTREERRRVTQDFRVDGHGGRNRHVLVADPR